MVLLPAVGAIAHHVPAGAPASSSERTPAPDVPGATKPEETASNRGSADQQATVDWNTRLVTGDAVTEITRLKTEDGGPMDIGGATLAAAAMRAGLIDEYVLVTAPVLAGGGTPSFTALDSRANLPLSEFGCGLFSFG